MKTVPENEAKFVLAGAGGMDDIRCSGFGKRAGIYVFKLEEHLRLEE